MVSNRSNRHLGYALNHIHHIVFMFYGPMKMTIACSHKPTEWHSKILCLISKQHILSHFDRYILNNLMIKLIHLLEKKISNNYIIKTIIIVFKKIISILPLLTFCLAALSFSNSPSSSSITDWSSLIFLLFCALAPCSSSKREFRALISASLLNLKQ